MSRLIDQCDRVWSQIVRQVDGRCVVCGETRDLQCGHLFTRAKLATRYHPMNCYAQCQFCNDLHERDPSWLENYFIQEYGRGALEGLRMTSNEPAIVGEWILKEVLRELTKCWKEVQAKWTSRRRLLQLSTAWTEYFFISKPAEATSTASSSRARTRKSTKG